MEMAGYIGRIVPEYAGGRRRYPWNEMKPGEWFFVPLFDFDKSVHALSHSVRTAAIKASKTAGVRFVVKPARGFTEGVEVFCEEKSSVDGRDVRREWMYLPGDRSTQHHRAKINWSGLKERAEILEQLMYEIRNHDKLGSVHAPIIGERYFGDDEGELTVTLHNTSPYQWEMEGSLAKFLRDLRAADPSVTIDHLIAAARQYAGIVNKRLGDGIMPDATIGVSFDDKGLIVLVDTVRRDTHQEPAAPAPVSDAGLSAEPF